MSSGLPHVTGRVLADAIDALSPRLRKRLDDSVAKAAAWDVSVAGDRVTVTVDEDTRVVLTVRDDAIRSGDDAVCTCLLAPACLHRTAVLGLAPVLDEADAPAAAAQQESTQPTEPQTVIDQTQPASVTPTPEQLAAAEALQSSARELIDIGLVGSGLATEANLRRAVHAARAAGLHAPAATGSRVAAQLRAFRTRSQEHSLAAYTDELRTLMATARAVQTITDPQTLATLRGTARRHHDRQGGMKLAGFFTEAVIASSGMAGVVTTVADPDGTLWSVPAVAPGGPERVEAAYRGPVGLGGAALSHQELVRNGLLVSGAAASADGSLSHGAGVRAVRSTGSTWWEPPLDTHFTAPEHQLERVFAAPQRMGDDMLFCEATILSANFLTAIRVARTGDVAISFDGRVALLRSPNEHPALAYTDNLKILSLAPGLRIRVVARPDRTKAGVLYPLAAAPDPTQTVLHLPETWQGRICLGTDRLHDSMVIAGAAASAPVAAAATTTATEAGPTDAEPLEKILKDPTSDIPLHHLRSAIERAAAGGRRTARFAATHDDARHLRSAGMPHAAMILDQLSRTASARERDDYGRAIPEAVSGFAETWLAAALFESAASTQLAIAAWSQSRT